MSDKKNKEQDLTAKQKERFLELLPLNRYHISNTCKKVGVHRNTFLYWKKTDEDFKNRYDDIQEQKMDDSEERLYLLSQGIPKIDKSGKLIGWEVKPNLGALVVQLKAQAKDRGYGDHIVIDDKREDELRNKTDEELMQEIAKLQKRYLKNDENGENNKTE